VVLSDNRGGYCGQATVAVVLLPGVRSIRLGRSADARSAPRRGDFKPDPISVMSPVQPESHGRTFSCLNSVRKASKTTHNITCGAGGRSCGRSGAAYVCCSFLAAFKRWACGETNLLKPLKPTSERNRRSLTQRFLAQTFPQQDLGRLKRQPRSQCPR
jgi:hypothetical protein